MELTMPLLCSSSNGHQCHRQKQQESTFLFFQRDYTCFQTDNASVLEEQRLPFKTDTWQSNFTDVKVLTSGTKYLFSSQKYMNNFNRDKVFNSSQIKSFLFGVSGTRLYLIKSIRVMITESAMTKRGHLIGTLVVLMILEIDCTITYQSLAKIHINF